MLQSIIKAASPPPHPRPEKKSFFSIGTSENRIKSAIWVTRKRNSRHEVVCFLFIEQEKQIRWNMMDLLSHWNNHFLWVAGVSVLTKGQWNFQHLLEVLSDNKILLAFNIKPICWYRYMYTHTTTQGLGCKIWVYRLQCKILDPILELELKW